jgi:plasmid maintenance system antidote protein VapI
MNETRRARLRTAFGRALDAQLERSGTTQTVLAASLGRSTSYLNQVIHGRKTASPALVDAVADRLETDDATRQALHRAAALDHGFKLDLTERKDPSPSG